MECGETDLKTYLGNVKKANQPLDTNMIRLTWQQMLTAVNVIHQHNIIHSDLKPANFLGGDQRDSRNPSGNHQLHFSGSLVGC